MWQGQNLDACSWVSLSCELSVTSILGIEGLDNTHSMSYDSLLVKVAEEMRIELRSPKAGILRAMDLLLLLNLAYSL